MNSIERAILWPKRDYREALASPNCGAYVISATWSEQVSAPCIRNVWSRDVCRCVFETCANLPLKQNERERATAA